MSPLKKAAAAATEQPFVIKQSKSQGRGGYATRDIRKGERLIEYVGERISWKEADRRYDDDGMGRHHTFLFAVTTRTVLDGAVKGNDSRYINHACDPNCEAIEEEVAWLELCRQLKAFGRLVTSGFELFQNHNWLAVHIGQGNIPERWDPLVEQRRQVPATARLASLRRVIGEAADAMPTHRAFLAANCPAPV